MTRAEKKFGKDLLQALDIGMGQPVRTQEEYENDLTGDTRKEVLRTVRYLMENGYRHVSDPRGEQL